MKRTSLPKTVKKEVSGIILVKKLRIREANSLAQAQGAQENEEFYLTFPNS